MGIFLGILAVIGKILLIILLVIAVLLLLILFLPVVYRARIVKNKERFCAGGSVRWLFGAVSFRFAYENKVFLWTLRIFGFPLHKVLRKKKKPVKIKVPTADADTGEGGSENESIPVPETEYKPAKKQPTIQPGEKQIEIELSREDLEKKIPLGEAEERGRAEDGNIKKVKSPDEFEEETKPSFIEKIKFKFKDICDKLKKVKGPLKAFGRIKGILADVLRSILPKKIKGFINFGFEDPSNTGMVYAILGMLCIPIPEGLALNPDFEEKRFECDVTLSGRIFIIILLIAVIRLLKIQEIRELLGIKGSGKKRKSGKASRRGRKHTKKYRVKIRQGGRHG